MKKNVLIFIILFCLSQISFSQSTYFGFSGLNFIPTGFATKNGQFNFSYFSRPAQGVNMNLYPYSLNFNFGFSSSNLEVGLTNTPLYEDNFIQNKTKSQDIKKASNNMIVPLFPSLKYSLIQEEECGIALGLCSPYGLYGIISDKKPWFLNSKLHLGIHMPFNLGILLGLECNLQKNLKIILENNFTWATELNLKNTSFFSFGLKYNLTSQISTNFVFRINNGYSGIQKTYGHIGLTYTKLNSK
ncbi:MAG: hypothetical protein ABIB46_02205 [bacterium]